ncbi:PAS domain-containing protein [Tardiphaga sp.]|uniref:PAS domain-containing protein n=1 Tax=Tardiphaga sp. TaxID=1926292 RepID=UPI0026074036|nr:PAS domain-containing protein [Tardiphaga sp.]MDB5618812.1 sensor signal transduction histidine kinase [Tardiphaga sp.]
MNSAEFRLRGIDDARLALHATSNQPVWLWSLNGTRVLWANPVGARLFGASHAAALFDQQFGPADPHRRQLAQLAERLPENGSVRLERLRGFGAALGSLMTCACTRLGFADGGAGILVVAVEPTGRFMPLSQRLKNLVEGLDTPIAAFARDGQFVGASDAARALLGFHDLTEAGLGLAREEALKDGRHETPIGFGHMVLQRVGSGADIGLVALIVPGMAEAAPSEPQVTEPPATDTPVEQADMTDTDDTLESAEVMEHEAEVDPATTPEADTEHPEVAPPPEPEPTSELEAAIAGTIARAEASSHLDAAEPAHAREPSPYVEAVADEPAPDAPAPVIERQQPLRFTWQIDADGRFALNSNEFIQLIGPHSAAASIGLWREIATDSGLDPDGRVMVAMATRAPWSGITMLWPVDGGGRLPVELAGLPLFDRDHQLIGWRGFGICRDFEALSQLTTPRHHEASNDPPLQSLSADIAQAGPVGDSLDEPIALTSPPIPDITPSTEPDHIVDIPQNVVPFRPGDLKLPALTPVENSAFNELARQLSARLEADGETPTAAAFGTEAVADEQPESIAMPREQALLDLLPVPVLVTRDDRLLHANPAFLDMMGYPSVEALEQAGGLDAHYAEPDDGVSPVPTDVRTFAIDWDGEPAEGLIFSTSSAATAAVEPAEIAAPAIAAEQPVAAQADAEELAAILDTMAEGVVMFDAEGNIHACNRSAEALFGYDGALLTQRNLIDLFAQESQRVLREYIESLKHDGVASLFEHGREALGQVRAGGLVPMSVMIGRTRSDAGHFFAVLRDLTQAKKTESELLQAQRQSERAATAKADVLARLSHEVRTPLNAIIGFAEVMIDERFGALGNERYIDYMKDVRASGERVLAIVNDLLDLSRIETGKLDLAFAAQNLNEMVEQCVSVMQPQANRGRIIIRTSLSHLLPVVTADARALRQITLNLIGNSIHLANAGGQVIVSTALSDDGDVVLRIRDTGHGLNDNELAAAMEPFRHQAPTDQTPDSAAVSLSLTKALVEANRARFQIKTAPSSGTLIEVMFSDARVTA